MKVIVNCQVNYSFEMDVPDDAEIQDRFDYLTYADVEDPVYHKIARILTDNNIDFDGEITSIYDSNYSTLYEI